MKTPDEIKADLFYNYCESEPRTLKELINLTFSLGVEEGKKQIIDRIKCTYCPMCGLEWDNCNCGELAFNVVWLRSKLNEDKI